MFRKITFIAGLLMLLAVPTLAQEETQVEIRMDSTQVTSGSQLIVEIMVKNGSNIAGADIAVAVDGNCLQVDSMIPGDYLPSTAENGGFAPMNMFDNTSARLAANVTDRQRVANGDGVFMTVLMNADCVEQASTIDVTRAELVTVDGEQFTAAFSSLDLQISSPVENNEVVQQTFAPEGDNQNGLLTVAIGLMLFGLIGLMSLIGWQVSRSRASAR